MTDQDAGVRGKKSKETNQDHTGLYINIIKSLSEDCIVTYVTRLGLIIFGVVIRHLDASASVGRSSSDGV